VIKHIMLVRRKPGISRDEFYRYWKDVHGPLIAPHMPGLKKYVQNHFVDMPGFEYEGDGLVENYYETLDDLKTALAFNDTPEQKKLGLLEDWAKIASLEKPRTWFAEEHTIFERP
jgi:uncharacterized protein (TIGR02118 family)